MSKKPIKNEIVIYQAKSGAIELRGDFRKVDAKRNMQKMHIANSNSVCANIARTAADGKI